MPLSGCSRSLCLAAAALMAVAVAVCPFPAAATVAQDPHRAFYRLEMGRITGSSGVVGVKGAMTSEWEKGCDGWTATQQLAVTMERQEGAAAESSVSASIFETHDGTKLRFTSKTTVDRKVIEQVRGRAERASATAPGKAYYIEPKGLTIDLPAGTLFPYQHTLAIIAAAASGTGRDFSPFFDGSQPEKSPLDVSSLVLGAARGGDEGPGTGLGALTAHRWWLVRLAFFPDADDTAEPEIEMTQYLQENGVVRRFDFDYGEFTVIATLERIEPLAEPACQ
jgi:hypothetical protein